MSQPQYFTAQNIDDPKVSLVYTAFQRAKYSDQNIIDSIHLLKKLQEAGWENLLKEYKEGSSDRFSGLSVKDFTEIVALIEFSRGLIRDEYGIDKKLFGREHVYAEDARRARLGLGDQSSGHLQDHIRDAILLLDCFLETRLFTYERIKSSAPLVKPAEEPPISTPPSDQPTAGVIPVIPGGGTAADKNEQEKKEEEQEKKKEEEEKRKHPEKPLEKDSFQKLAESDRLFRREVMRIESAITHQLASIYGVPEGQYQAFSEQIARYVTPIILVKLKSLNSTDLETALQNSPFARIKIYQQTLSSLQRSVVFQATLKKYLMQSYKQAGKELTEDQIQELSKKFTIEQVAQGAEPFYVQAVNQDKSQGENPLTPAQITALAESHAVSADTIENSLRNLLKQTQLATGRQIADSQINDIFIRLQRLGLTKQYAATLNDSDLDAFFTVFKQSFGHEANGIIQSLRFATGAENDRFLASLLLHYSDKVSLAIFHHSAEVPSQRNLAALYAVPQNVPGPMQKEVDKSLEINIHDHGYTGVGLAMFASTANIQRRKAGTKKEENIIARALGFKSELQYHMEKSAQKTRVLDKKSKRIFSVREKTITYLFGQIFGIETTDIQTRMHFDRFDGEADYYELMPSFLMDLGDDELFESFNLPFFSAEQGGAEQDNEEAQKRKDEEMGLFAAKILSFIFLSPEAFEAVEKIYQVAGVVRQIPIIGGIVDTFVLDKFRLFGKLFDLLLKGMLFLMALNILGPILWILGALKAWDAAAAFFQQLNLFSALQSWMNNLTRGVGEFAGTAAKNTASGAQATTRHLAGMNGAAQEVLGAPVSANAVIYGTVGIVVGTVIVQSVIMSSFLTPRQYAGGLLNLPRNGLQPPNIGCLKPITQLADINTLSPLVGDTLEPLTDTQISQIAQAAGQAFASKTYFNLLCALGDINVAYAPGKQGAGEVFRTNGTYTIVMRMKVLGSSVGWSQGVVNYTLIHEMGHVLDNRTGLGQKMAQNNTIAECFPTYPLKTYCAFRIIPESFAEANTIYINPECYPGAATEPNFTACGTFNFNRDKPQLYNWIRTNVFGGEI